MMMDLMHFQTCKKAYFLEVQQYGHPGDEDKNFCVLCLIDVSIIAIVQYIYSGGGGQFEMVHKIEALLKQ